ncbi:MAG: G8 domain-containing protein [Phycisphaerales bacterium]
MKRLFTSVWVVVCLAASASATTKTFVPSSGIWNDVNNWSPSGLPTVNDNVVIPGGKVCNVDITTATAQTMEVYGTLNIQPGKKLTLDLYTSNVPLDSIVDGIVTLVHDNTGFGTLTFAQGTHTVTGDGRIAGQEVTCTIEVGSSSILTNELAGSGEGIRESLTIRGLTASGQTNGTFVNQGLVEAVGHLTLHADTILDDDGTGLWKAVSCKTVLQFDRQALGLDGDFQLGCGSKFLFNASIKTCGTLIYNSTGIDVENSATFQYAAFSGSQANPGSATPPVTCNNPWTVSADDCCCVCL